MELFNEFIESVETNPDIHNTYVKLAVKRHLNDVIKAETTDYPYYFNEEEADRWTTIVKLTRHTGGKYAGTNFQLTPSQAFTIGCLFGWLRKDNDLRRFTKAYEEIARKNGKSEKLSALSCAVALFDGEIGAQILIAATKKEQCDYVFKPIKFMMGKLKEDFEEIRGLVKINRYEVLIEEMNTEIKRLTADSNKEDGANPHFATVDEYHAHPDDSMLKIIETGVVSRTQPIVYIITTAGFNKEGPCYQLRTVVKNILNGSIENENFFGIIFTIDDDDDWNDEKVWIKSNPNIGITPTWEGIRQAYVKAITEGATAEVEFKTKNLNVWCDAPDVWIPSKAWSNCASDKIDLADFWGKKMYLGLDLASVEDLAALSILFPPQDGIENPILFMKFYCPSAKVQETKRKDGVDYRKWVKDGHIIMTPGNQIDYDYIKNDILNLAANHKMLVCEYDKYNSQDLIPKLEEENLYCDPHPQGFLSMNAPVKRTKILVNNHPLNKREIDEELQSYLKDMSEEESKMYLVHDGNPVMSWMIGNVEIHFDAAGNQKIVKNSVKGGGKKKSNNKVDGPVALAMAVTALIFPPDDNESVYNKKDLLVI